jgi:hypothetical protein
VIEARCCLGDPHEDRGRFVDGRAGLIDPPGGEGFGGTGEGVGEAFVAEEGGEHADDASAELGYLAGDLRVAGGRGLSVKDGPAGAMFLDVGQEGPQSGA